MPQRSDVIPRPDFAPPPAHLAGARAGIGTGVIAGGLAALGSTSLGFGASVLGVFVLVGSLGGVLFDRASRARDSAVFPLAFGLLGAVTGALVLALTLGPELFIYSWLPSGTAFWSYLLAAGAGALGGGLVGASAGVSAGRRTSDDPLPAAARAAAIAGVGALGFAKVGMLGVHMAMAGPLSSAIATVGFAVSLVGAWTLGSVAALAAGAGTLLAAGRQAWVEQDDPNGPVLAGNLLHASSELNRAMRNGQDPSIH